MNNSHLQQAKCQSPGIDSKCPNRRYSRIGHEVTVADGLDEQLGQFDDFLATPLLLVLQGGVRVGRLLHLGTVTLLRNHRLACKGREGT